MKGLPAVFPAGFPAVILAGWREFFDDEGIVAKIKI
jgi:hypothetical protein